MSEQHIKQVEQSDNSVLTARVAQLEKINQALMNKVERSVDLQGGAFGLFQSATILQHTVRQRTLELEQVKKQLRLANRELQQTNHSLQNEKAEADAANRKKTAFLASMSRDIRTPMNGVLGMLNLVLDNSDQLSQQQIDYLNIAYRSGNTLLALLNNILDLSKLESGTIELEKIDFDLRQAVEEVTDLFAEHAFCKGVDMGCQISLDIPERVRGDSVRFRQILSNLINNAVKFTESGQIEIRVALAEIKPIKANHLNICCEVEDSGVGIPEAMQTHIFDAFSQADNSAPGNYDGSGLGLPLSKQLLERMQGEITLMSEEDVGSCFAFELAFEHASSISPWQPLGKLRRHMVLILQSDNIHRRALTSYLTEWGLSYHICDEVGLLEKLLEGTPLQYWHCIMLDYHLDQSVDGRLYACLKRVLSAQATPLLMLCTRTSYQDGLSCQQHTVPTLSKPISRDKLHHALKAALGLQSKPDLSYSPQVPDSNVSLTAQKRILLVEDNLFNQKVAYGMLKRLGFEADVANNGQEAMDSITEQQYDLILMDCQMPIMDGYVTTEAIRRREQQHNNKHTPIVAMTANAMEGDRALCMAAQMDDYISKPVDLTVLSNMLTQWLNLPIVDQAP